jgi:thiamine transport system permease protein
VDQPDVALTVALGVTDSTAGGEDSANRRVELSLPGRRLSGALTLVAVVTVTGLMLWPLATVVKHSGLDLGALNDAHLRAVIWFTTWQAAASTGAALLVGLPATWALSRLVWRGRGAVRALATGAFVLPPVVIALAMGVALPGARRDGVGWLIATHALVNAAVVIRVVGPAWEHLDDLPRQAARVLGASPLRAFLTVTARQLSRAISAASAAVFLFCLSSFGIAKVIAGPRHPTIEVEIARQALQLLRVDRASALALIQLLIVLIVLALASLVTVRPGSQHDHFMAASTRRQRVLVAACCFPIVMLIGVPLAALVWRSLHVGGDLSLDAYRGLADRRVGSGLTESAWSSVGVSLRYAVTTAAAAMIVGTIIAVVIAGRRRGARTVEVSTTAMMGLSSVLLGLGYLLMRRWSPMSHDTLAVPMAHLAIALPLVVRTMTPALEAVDPDARAAAALAGCSPRQVWWHVDRPIVRRAALAGGALAMAVSFGEFGASSFLVRGDRPTVPVAIVRLLGRPGAVNLSAALALSVVLLTMVALPGAAADRWARR